MSKCASSIDGNMETKQNHKLNKQLYITYIRDLQAAWQADVKAVSDIYNRHRVFTASYYVFNW